MPETLYAAFSDYKMAEKAVGALLDHGMRKEDISLISNAPGNHESHAENGITTTTGADAAAGAAKGAGIGLAVGALGALASLLIPGFGLVTGGGALATALGAAAGTTAGGAVAGGMTGYLQDQGVEEVAAVDYEEAVKRGGAVVELHLPSNDVGSLQAEQLLNKYAASNIRRGSGAGRTALDPTMVSATPTAPLPAVETVPIGQAFAEFDPEFQTDYRTRFATGRAYSDYEPVYRYGYDLASDTRYRDRDWLAIESDARSNWKGQSTWDEVKDGVRHAYDRVRSGNRIRQA